MIKFDLWVDLRLQNSENLSFLNFSKIVANMDKNIHFRRVEIV